MDGMFMEMEICLEVQLGIDKCQIKSSAMGAISMTEVLSALETEPDETKILP